MLQLLLPCFFPTLQTVMKIGTSGNLRGSQESGGILTAAPPLFKVVGAKEQRPAPTVFGSAGPIALPLREMKTTRRGDRNKKLAPPEQSFY